MTMCSKQTPTVGITAGECKRMVCTKSHTVNTSVPTVRQCWDRNRSSLGSANIVCRRRCA